MIKEKLMKALKTAAADYNGGMNADYAVACAAEAWDFNEKQAERLVEMFNTLAAINKERDKEDPTGACELATKEAVAKILMDNCGSRKKASAAQLVPDYSFYSTSPDRTNPSIEARNSGRDAIIKAASGDEEAPEPPELNVSQRSLFKIINEKIALVKAAAEAADEVARQLRLEIERESIKVAKEIESPLSDGTVADMFKAACEHKKALANISEYSTKVADSDGGIYVKKHVFDSSPVDDLLKAAENIENNMNMVSEYEKKRDFYLMKAAEAESEMEEAAGLKKRASDKKTSLSDMFHGIVRAHGAANVEGSSEDAGWCVKMAELVKESGVNPEETLKLYEELNKTAAPASMVFGVGVPSVGEAQEALTRSEGVDSERRRIMNVRRAIILADLMTNDPIIRDADPNVVAEAYKTMIMSSPRVSLDKAQARAFLRSAVNSVAISPSDAKIITDVDKGVSLANIDVPFGAGRLSSLDSSIKDSNM